MSTQDNNSNGSALDQARANMLYWATKPRENIEINDFGHLMPEHPYAIAVLRECFDFWEQNANAKFRTKDKDGNEVLIKNPKLAIIDETIKCAFGTQMLNNLQSASAAVSGERAKMVLETVKDIGRPQGFLGNIMGAISKEEDKDDFGD